MFKEESAGLVPIASYVLHETNMVIYKVTSGDDSTMQAWMRHEVNGGKLHASIFEPKFEVNPSHQTRVFGKCLYNLASAKVSVSQVNKTYAEILNKN